jgi:PEP-CTERM motif
MNTKTKIFAVLGATTAAMALAVSAQASGIAYVTGSDPWGQTTNDAAMDGAFGAGNWTKINSGFADSVFTAGYDFIFMDGGDSNGAAFSSYFNGTGAAAAAAYVTGGGHLFANAAYNSGAALTNLGLGATSTYTAYSGTAALTAAGITAGLDAGLGTTSFTGSYFSHNSVGGAGFTTFITGGAGDILAGGAFGSGYYLIGGETTTNFHSPGADALNLRINELKFAANGAGAVPEASTWMMMIVGFGAAGGAMRYRRRRTTVSFG